MTILLHLLRWALRSGLRVLPGVFFLFSGTRSALSAEPSSAQRKTLFDLSANSLTGQVVSLSDFRGKVVLVVNTASKCGFTAQYEGLQNLYMKYKDRGLVILGFPSNDFGNQEPGTNEQIKEFCAARFGVTFPLFERNPVSGKEKQPVYRFLTEESGAEFKGEIGWNFEKFLVGPDGTVLARFGSFTAPESTKIEESVVKLLEETQRKDI